MPGKFERELREKLDDLTERAGLELPSGIEDAVSGGAKDTLGDPFRREEEVCKSERAGVAARDQEPN